MDKKQCIDLVHERAVSVLPDAVVGELMPCELCGWWGNCERHHRQFRSRGGQWLPSNILLLCPDCHLMATDEQAVEGVNVSQFAHPERVPVKLWYTDEPVCLDDEGGYDPCCLVDNA
jgi:5-methylcytosine-specific restriction endonuclease McrA